MPLSDPLVTPRAGARRPHVLVVDDDPGIRLICATILRLDGYDVLEAADGREALGLAFDHAPDLVLLDISMPVLDGFGLAAALRADARTRRLPLVFLSGETDPETRERADRSGARGFFCKPFDPAAISAFVTRTLNETATLQAV